MSKKKSRAQLLDKYFEDIQKNLDGDYNTPDEFEFESLAQKMFDLNLNLKEFGNVIYKLLPRLIVPKTVVDTLFGIVIRHYRFDLIHKSQLLMILEWYRGLVVYGFINRKSVEHFYYFYYQFLKNEHLVGPALHLIYLTTTHDNLSQWLINIFLSHKQKFKNRMDFKAVLSLFHRLKPNMEEFKPCEDEEKHFIKIPPKYVKNLKLLKLRREQNSGEQSTCNLELVSNSSMILNIENFISDINGQDMSKLNFFHLLNSDNAFIAMTLSSDKIRIGTSTFLTEFCQQILSEESEISRLSVKQFFVSMNNIQQLIGEQHNAISTLLYGFVKQWNGKTNRKLILQLLKYLPIKTFSKFYENIFRPLYDHGLKNFKNDMEYIPSVLETFSGIIYNNYKYLKKSDFVILTAEEAKENIPSKTDIISVMKLTDHFCKLSMNLFPDSRTIRHKVLDHYCRMCLAEQNIVKVTDLITIPYVISIRVYLSDDMYAINKLAMVFFNGLQLLLARELQPDENNLELSMFWHEVGDFYRFCKGEIDETDLFVIFGHQKYKFAEKFPNLKENFKLKNHPALLPLTHFDDNHQIKLDGPNEVLRIIHDRMPYVYATCKLYKKIVE